MNDGVHPVVVGVDGSAASAAAQRWAMTEAIARQLPLRLVCAYTWGVRVGAADVYAEDPRGGLADLRDAADRVIEAALTELKELDGGLEVNGDAIEGGSAAVLLRESASAAMLVLGSRQLHTAGSFLFGSVSAEVAARSACPTVVTRGPANDPPDGAVIVVGVDGSPESETMLSFAFDEAVKHGLSLHVVLCWNPSPLTGAYWMAGPAARDCEHLALWLSQTLLRWCEKYPDVMVTSTVPEQHPVHGLVRESAGQYMLVIGTHGQHAAAGTLLGSVSQGVLHHAVCPVAVVPLR